MPTAARQVPVRSQPDAVSRRQPIHGIKDMPAGYDAEVAELFRDLRAATALSEMELAAQDRDPPRSGGGARTGRAPSAAPWAETCRVVNAYGTMLNLDVRPLLRRIYAQLEAGIVELQPKPFPDVPTMTPPDSDDFGFGSGRGRRRRLRPIRSTSPGPRRSRKASREQAWPNAGPPGRPNCRARMQAEFLSRRTWPRPQGGPATAQAWPGTQAMPQAPRPAPGQSPAPPQPQQARRPTSTAARAAQDQQPQAQPPRQPQPSEAEMLEAAFGPGAAQTAPEPQRSAAARACEIGHHRPHSVAAIAAGLALLYVMRRARWGTCPAAHDRSRRSAQQEDRPPAGSAAAARPVTEIAETARRPVGLNLPALGPT